MKKIKNLEDVAGILLSEDRDDLLNSLNELCEERGWINCSDFPDNYWPEDILADPINCEKLSWSDDDDDVIIKDWTREIEYEGYRPVISESKVRYQISIKGMEYGDYPKESYTLEEALADRLKKED